VQSTEEESMGESHNDGSGSHDKEEVLEKQQPQHSAATSTESPSVEASSVPPSSTDSASFFPPQNLTFNDITEGSNERGIPIVKFIEEDLDSFASRFVIPAAEAPPDGETGSTDGEKGEASSAPTSTQQAELLIGAYSELHAKYKSFEATLTQKSMCAFCPAPEAKNLECVVSYLHFALSFSNYRATSGIKDSRIEQIVGLGGDSQIQSSRIVETAANSIRLGGQYLCSSGD
jgi:hypothetical protein